MKPNWSCLPPDLVARIIGFLPRNEIVCTVRLINKALSEQFKDYISVRMSEPSPHHAFVRRWGSSDAMRTLTLEQRQQLLALTARSGCLDNLEVAVAVADCPLTDEVFDAAASGGHLVMCQRLVTRSSSGWRTVTSAAAGAGHMPVVRWALQQPKLGPSTPRCALAWSAAALAGRRDTCEALLAEGIACEWIAPINAARGGHGALMDWLLQLMQDVPPEEGAFNALLYFAAHGLDLEGLRRACEFVLQAGGDATGLLQEWGSAVARVLSSPTADWRDKLQWLMRDHGCELSVEGVDLDDLAARSDCLERLHLMQAQMSPRAFRRLAAAAARRADLALLRHLWEGWPEQLAANDALEEAAKAGDAALVAGMVALGWRIRSCTFTAAAAAGHLHVLQWLAGPEAALRGVVALRKAMGRSLGKAAAGSGNVEVLKWVLELGCRLDESAFEAAAGSGSPVVLEALAARGCPMGATGRAYLLAGANGDLVTLRCLRRLGCPWGPDAETFSLAVFHRLPKWEMGRERFRRCSLVVLRWLVAEGCPVDWEAARRQAMERNDSEAGEVRAWLEERTGRRDVGTQCDEELTGV